MAPAQVGERFEDRRVRPGALDLRGDAAADPHPAARGPTLGPGQHGRLAHPRRAADEQRPAAAAGHVAERHFSTLRRTRGGADQQRARRRRVGRPGGLGRVGEQPGAQRDGLPAGADTELTAQGQFQPLELPQSAPPIPAPGQPGDQREMRLLVGRLDGQQLLPPSGQAEHVEVAEPEPLPGLLGPCRRTGRRAADRRRSRRAARPAAPGPRRSAPPAPPSRTPPRPPGSPDRGTGRRSRPASTSDIGSSRARRA